MDLNFATIDDSNTATYTTQNALDILSKNTVTSVGVVIGAGTAVAAGALVTAALPAQMLTAAAVSAGCIYAGDRQHKGFSINPFASKDEPKVVKTETVADVKVATA